MSEEKELSEKELELAAGGVKPDEEDGAIAMGTKCRYCKKDLGTLPLLRKHLWEVHNAIM